MTSTETTFYIRKRKKKTYVSAYWWRKLHQKDRSEINEIGYLQQMGRKLSGKDGGIRIEQKRWGEGPFFE